MRLEISEDQVERIIKKDLRYESGIELDVDELLNNPYLISENDCGISNYKGEVLSEKIPLEIIDHAMVPSFYFPDKIYSSDSYPKLQFCRLNQ